MPCLHANVYIIPICRMPQLPEGMLLKTNVHSDQREVLLKCRSGFNNCEVGPEAMYL